MSRLQRNETVGGTADILSVFDGGLMHFALRIREIGSKHTATNLCLSCYRDFSGKTITTSMQRWITTNGWLAQFCSFKQKQWGVLKTLCLHCLVRFRHIYDWIPFAVVVWLSEAADWLTPRTYSANHRKLPCFERTCHLTWRVHSTC